MAFLEIVTHSDVLGMDVRLNAVIPQRLCGTHGFRDIGRPDGKYPVLYLLHGMSYDYTSWERYTRIEYLAEQKGIAVIMPDCWLSWYTDMKRGKKYFTYLTDELPKICARLFPNISLRPDDTFVAGLSMGAYGALKCAILKPEKYSYCGAFSAPPDMKYHMTCESFPPEEISLYGDIFGTVEDYLKNPDDNIVMRAAMGCGGVSPHIYLCCGKQDWVYPQSVMMRDALVNGGWNVTFTDGDGGHDWNYWNIHIERFMNYLPER